ncbi:MAG: hypothetical protein J3K34DRAFT_443751 [Monoraphidium minutum]|nr:MAG: hypothetical protein J3K34DRAFT_443751 [Monoraphidium minutum]
MHSMTVRAFGSSVAPAAPAASALDLRVPRRVRRPRVATEALPVVATGLAIVGAALLLEELKHQERTAHEATNERPCPSCHGSGYQPCLCQRWSDGDTGCNSCSHSGYMRCRSCGGGGRAIPIKATIKAPK